MSSAFQKEKGEDLSLALTIKYRAVGGFLFFGSRSSKSPFDVDIFWSSHLFSALFILLDYGSCKQVLRLRF